MSHFYGGIHGARGPATRMGTKSSGFEAYAQGYGSRISVSFHYNNSQDCDAAGISISGGYNSGARTKYIGFSDIDLVVEALDSGDPKIEKLWGQVHEAFDKIEAEAPKALERARKAREREVRRQRKEEREKAKRLAELRETVTHTERHFYVSLVVGMDEEDRMEFFSTDDKIDDHMFDTNRPEPYRNEDGHLIVGHRAGGSWGRLTMFDITAGKEVEREEVEVA
jgi:predicted nucleotidyltransferase